MFKVYFGIEETSNGFIFVNHLRAYKKEGFKVSLVKEKTEKYFFKPEELKAKLLEIENMFMCKSVEFYSNIEHPFLEMEYKVDKNILKGTIAEMREELESSQKINEVPEYIYLIGETEFQRNSLLFLITVFFNENPSKIFDFPLFLKLKEEEKIEQDVEVEGFIEDRMEEIRGMKI